LAKALYPDSSHELNAMLLEKQYYLIEKADGLPLLTS